MSARTLTIRLLRKGCSTPDAFSATFSQGAERGLTMRAWNGVEGAQLFIGQIYSNPPGWRDFLQTGAADLPDNMFTGGAGAAIFLPLDDRVVVVCFGQIHIALNDDAFERQFGLRVTLNTVRRGNLRTLDLATPDAVTFQRRIQASKDSDLQAFGVDVLRDLAQVAGGTPSEPSFARFVAGKDSLSITCEVDPTSIVSKCKEILNAYRRKDYQTEFSWVDNMRVVAEKDALRDLDAILLAALTRLRNGKSSELHMAPPEVVNYTEGCELHYNGFGSHGATFMSLSIFDYVAELERCNFEGDMEEIKQRHRIRARRDGAQEFSEKWRVYDCFVFEASLGSGGEQKHYVLFAGTWYCIERKFKESVEAFFQGVEKVSIVGKTQCINEEDLIADIATTRSDRSGPVFSDSFRGRDKWSPAVVMQPPRGAAVCGS